MSLPRFLVPLVLSHPTGAGKFTSKQPRPCWCNLRHLSSSQSAHMSSQRRIQTATAPRPQTLDFEPPPRSYRVTDLTGATRTTQINNTRSPRLAEQLEISPN